MKRFAALLLALVLALGLFPAAGAAQADAVTVLFTHDLHSHLLPTVDEQGVVYGGYARLKTAIDAQKALHPDAILVDGGDFSMGTLFQAVYATDAAELRIMGTMGYDAVTFGNHEYDYRSDGLTAMLHAAADSGEPLPAIVESNYLPPEPGHENYGEEARLAWEAFERAGVTDYTVIERGGVHFALFGVMGFDSHACAPTSGMVLHDPVETSRRVVAAIEAEVPEPRVVICLSHSGTHTNPKLSEDEQLAHEVDGIDVIISGHTHTTIYEPIVVNGVYLVSAGEYGRNLGSLRLIPDGDGWAVSGYDLIPIDDTLPGDPAIEARVAELARQVEENYLSRFGNMTFDQTVAYNSVEFESLARLNDHREAALGNLIADAYRWAVEEAEGPGGAPVDFALTANGVIRASFPVGEITTGQVFDVLSLGIGADGVPGYPLVSVYLTGKDLKNAFEVDASVTALMSPAQLYFTGMSFTFNPNRMLFNKVTDCAQLLPDGSAVPIEDNKLYRVVTGLYCGQMLGEVNSKSFGILSITPRDADGNPITDLEAHIVHTGTGAELKEWYALASYLEHLGTVPAEYGVPQGRKVVHDSLNPIDLLRNPNWITLAALAILLALVLIVILIVRLILRGRRKKRK